jgi:menaquinone-dependent protoporphyrinogen oxidase
MQPYILVAYASKYGATKQIAEKIGQVLTARGLLTDVETVQEVGKLTPYTAVVFGSAVYAGSWLKEAAEFLKEHEAALAARPTWLFSSGPTGEGDPVTMMKGWRFPEALQPIADRIQPRDIAVFHGDIDSSKLNFIEKLIVKGVKAPMGDFRDWDAVERWATGIAQSAPLVRFPHLATGVLPRPPST